MAYPLHGDPPRNPVGSSPPLPTPGDEVLERVIGLIPDRRDRFASADLAYLIDEFLATPSVAFPDGGANG